MLTSAVFLRFKEPAAQASVVFVRCLVGATLSNAVVINVVEVAALLSARIRVAMGEADITIDNAS